MDSRLLMKPRTPLTIYDIGALVDTAFKRSMTPSNITAGFRRSGIFHFDENIFADSDFAPSLVTDRPCPESASPVMNPEPGPSHENGCSSANTSGHCFQSPEEIRGYPKAAPRKESGRGRKKGRSMIATDTPEKEAIAQSRTKPHKPVQHSKSIKQTRTKSCPRKLVFEEDDSSSEEELVLSDHSSDNFDEEMESESHEFRGLESEPQINDYILVEFDTTPKKYYMGHVIRGKDDEGDYEVSYLRRTNKSMSFFFPMAQDVASINLSDIKAILPKPNAYGKTKRQNAYLTFDFNFGFLNVN